MRSRHNRTSTGALLPKPSLRRVLSGDGRQGSFNRERDNPHSDQTVLYVLCPPTVDDRNGRTYPCSFKYLGELAQKCREVIDPAISDMLEEFNLFDPKLHEANRAETIDAVESAAEVPDWAKALATRAFDRMDFADIATKVAKSRVDKMRALLGHP